MSETFSAAAFKRELGELRLKSKDVAKVLRKSPSLVHLWLDSMRRPSDSDWRAMNTMFTIIRVQSVSNGGSFALSKKNILLLQRAIAEAERSVVRSNRPTNDHDTRVEESSECRAN